MNHSKIIKSTLLFFVFILSITGLSFNLKYFFYEKAGASLSDGFKTNNNSLADNSYPEDINIDAESIMSVEIEPVSSPQILKGKTWDDKEKILFSKNEEKKLPIASLTKLMTALVVLEQYNLSQKMVISDLAMAQEGDQGNLKAGEVLSVKDLLYITLIESSNKAAFALSEAVGLNKFVELMNSKADELGFKNTHFEDSTGLSPGSYSTAKDLAKLSAYLFDNYPLFREITNTKEFDLYSEEGRFHHKLINTNKLLGKVSGVVGGKTGWTNFSKGCFIIIQKNPKNENYLIHVILRVEDRLLEMEKLISFINNSFNL